MNKPSEAFVEREERLGELVSDWLESLESGKAPDRREWLARYPEYASELAEFLDEEDRMRSLAAPLREAAQAALVSTSPPWRTLDLEESRPDSFGDYELLEEIGRGGMAVVYRARQKGLDRFVALKLFRSDRLGRVTDLERFRHEAQIVAQLDHPLVVPIHEVGEHHGLLYFTMKLIEGGSLDTQLTRFQSNPQATAGLLVSIARAVHHAHQRGILHRDLKPSNILVTGTPESSPHEFIPHVSDFGLAKRVDTDMSLTQTGAVVGTPAYMAPEQAASEKTAITTATDVYGLGTILYALLTGKAPFGAESVLETLTQVKEREPESPSRNNSNVPRDLETICLKCLRKEPQRRYESASALADDLERWRRGEPITARPVGRVERLWRWCRRQPIQAALGSALILAVVCGFVLVLWQWRRAEANYSRAEENFSSAESLRKEAVAREVAVDESFHLAHGAVRDFTGILEDSGELQNRGLDPLRRQVLLKAQSYYRKFLEQRGQDPKLRLELAHASIYLAHIIRKIGSPAEALAAYREAVEQVAKLSQEDPDNLKLRTSLAELHNFLASVYDSLGRHPDAFHSLEKAKEILDASLIGHPGNTDILEGLARTLHNMGMNLSAAKRIDEALVRFAQAEKIVEQLLATNPDDVVFLRHLASNLNSMGTLYSQHARSTEGLQPLRKAVELSDRLAKINPTEQHFQYALAVQLCALAECLYNLKDARQAQPNLTRARSILEELVGASPHVPEYQVSLGMCNSLLAKVLLALNDLDQAAPTFDRAKLIFRQLAKDYPASPDYLYRQIQVMIEIAQTHKRLKHPKAANDIYEEAQDLAVKLVEKTPNQSKYESQRATILHHLAIVQGEASRFGDARELVLQAAKWDRRVLDRDKSDSETRKHTTSHYVVLAAIDRELGRFDEAMDAAKKRQELWPNDPTELYRVAGDYALTGTAAKADAKLQLRCSDLAIEAFQLAIKAGFRDVEEARTNSELELIRSREDFQKLLDEMKKKQREP